MIGPILQPYSVLPALITAGLLFSLHGLMALKSYQVKSRIKKRK